MFTQMDSTLSPMSIKTIKELTEDSIRKTNPYITNLIKEYDYYNDSKIVTDLEARNINYDDRYELFAIAYHRYLNKLDLKLDDEYKYYDSIHIARDKEFEVSLTRDSVNGKYIPSNLADCFIELDKILSSRNKAYIRKNGTSGLHMTLGMFSRNRWQLWGGSRLKKYFLDTNGGMMHEILCQV
jgi:hypothetical protein